MILLGSYQLRSLSFCDGASLHSNYALSSVFLQNLLLCRRGRQEVATFFLNHLLFFEVWELSPLAFLSLLIHIQLYTEREIPEQTGNQKKKIENETKKE